MSDETNKDSGTAKQKGRWTGYAWIWEECLLPTLLLGGVVFAVVDGMFSISGGGGIV